jgi:DNA-binding NarL/FixJ family response regulator
MKLLLIENDRDFLNVLTSEFSNIPNVEVCTAASRESAFEELQTSSFDLIVCDLKIPTRDGALDDDIEHGLAVYSKATDLASGTPILILSAFGTLDIVTRLLQDAQRKDILGTRIDYPMKDFVQKARLPDCISKVTELANEITQLDSIEISSGNARIELSTKEKRALRIFARRLDGRIVEIAELGSGLSDAKTLRLQVIDSRGQICTMAVAKIAGLDKIVHENLRYQSHVAPRLDVGAFTTRVDEVQAGASDVGAIFYTLARTYEKSLFDLLSDEPGRGATVVPRLRSLTARWLEGAPLRPMRARDIRRGLLSDDDIVSCAFLLDGIDWQGFEEREVSVRHCCQHRDLHGLNVLISEDDSPVLIDYGEVDFASASLDPITLELSLLFHPKGEAIRGAWPSEAQAFEWDNLDRYTRNCPVPEFIRACREWAHNVSAGNREVYSNAYAFSVRQLKYNDTNHTLAVSIISSVIEAMNRT